MKVFVPIHPTADWGGLELSRLRKMKETGSRAKTTYIRPKHYSIREHIALAKKTHKI